MQEYCRVVKNKLQKHKLFLKRDLTFSELYGIIEVQKPK